MDKRTKLFWSEPDMEPWPKLEQDATRPELMKISGHAMEGGGEH